MITSLKNRLILSSLLVIATSGLIATLVGVRLIGSGVVKQAQEKVRMDLNTARHIYNHRLNIIESTVHLTTMRSLLKDALLQKDIFVLSSKLNEVTIYPSPLPLMN